MIFENQSNTTYNVSATNGSSSNVDFEIISKPDCVYCTRAKNLLKSKGIAFREYEIGTDVLREDVLQKFPNVRTVPIIVYKNEYLGGYTQLEAFISEKFS